MTRPRKNLNFKKTIFLWFTILCLFNLNVCFSFLNTYTGVFNKNFYQYYITYLEPYDYFNLFKKSLKTSQEAIGESISDKMQDVTQKNKTFKSYSMNKPIKVLLVGDSMMENIGKTFQQLTSQTTNWTVDVVSIPGSSLVENMTYNWPEELERLVKRKHYDVIVLSFGLNDITSITAENNKVYGFMSPEWFLLYQKKIDLMVSILPNDTVNYWLEPIEPHQALAGVGDRINEIDIVLKRVFESGKYPKLDLIYLRRFLQDQKDYQMPDGVHLNGHGANLVGDILIQQISQEKTFNQKEQVKEQ